MGGGRSREQGRNRVRGGRKGGGKTPGQQIQMRKNIYDNDDGDAVGDDDGDENENDDTGGLEDGEVWLA